tara:strand:+ start:830 stop:1072 length:243 start_codon:yes stop_codon:yes gene_type:complete
MTMLTTPDQIHRYGLAVLRHRLKLELRMPIWRVKSTLDSARRLGFQGRTRKQALDFVLAKEAIAWEGMPHPGLLPAEEIT